MIFMVLVVELIGYDQSSFLLLQSVDTTEYPHQPFLPKLSGVRIKTGGVWPGNDQDYSHTHVFQTNIYMDKTIYDSIQYYLRPFQ